MTGGPLGNIALARQILVACSDAGIEELVLCAGARNAPFVRVLAAARGVKTYAFFEERSAGFFALGRILSRGRPVAVITTSGTAAAELLPATIEADYQGLPLVLITADRPRRFRGSGAPQTIVQPGLYSAYVERSWDIEGRWDATSFRVGQRPVHLNVCFDEPLIDEEPRAWDWPPAGTAAVAAAAANATGTGDRLPLEISSRRPLVLIGGLPKAAASSVYEIVKTWRRPVYAEAPSHLRGAFAETVLEKDFPHLQYDSVIRIGSVPTVRLWRDLEATALPVWHFSHLPFRGLPRPDPVYPLAQLAPFAFEPWTPTLETKASPARLAALLERFPLSEPGWVHWLSRQLPSAPTTRLFLGNSLPIREWDLAASFDGPRPLIFANRGTNGIDGLISTFLGVAEESDSNWCLLGDLSTLYDLSGPWALRQRPLSAVQIVILNNGGGKIFQRLFNNALFENRHDLHFADWARLWQLDYLRLEQPAPLNTPTSPASRPRVIEIVPSETQTAQFWEAWT